MRGAVCVPSLARAADGATSVATAAGGGLLLAVETPAWEDATIGDRSHKNAPAPIVTLAKARVADITITMPRKRRYSGGCWATPSDSRTCDGAKTGGSIL